MPLKPERMENITNYLVQASSTYKPGFRSLSRYVEQLEQLGYTDDPAKVNLAKYESLTFDEIVEFYKQNVQNKNISIGIIGNKKEIDLKKLESIAEVKTLKTSDIFKN
jgi:predicted Zn-dependent peptidase